MYTERKDLVVGKIYFRDGSKRTKGVFKGRDEDTIYFDCEGSDRYYTVRKGEWEGLVPFNDKGGNFEEVAL